MTDPGELRKLVKQLQSAPSPSVDAPPAKSAPELTPAL
jgi:hypothetical protein